MKILDRYLFREMLLSWLAVTVVLLIIMIGNVLARSLGRVAEGGGSVTVVLLLVAVTTIGVLITLIPLGVYLGILLAHGRMYRDNEMSVMQACGIGWLQLMRPSAAVGVIGMFVIAGLTVFAAPWAARYEEQLKEDIRDRPALSLLTPGRFVESSDGRFVIFAQDANEAGTRFENVFMYRNREDREPVVDSAESASYALDDASGDEYLVFSDGQTVIGQPGSSEYAVTEFRVQGVLRPPEDASDPRLRTEGMTLTQLYRDGSLESQAELQWRISIPLAALLLSVLAVPLAYTSPRQGRFAKIAIAILLYIPYANLLVLARKAIAEGSWPAWIGLWPVHALVIVLILVMTARRLGWQWVRRRWFRLA